MCFVICDMNMCSQHDLMFLKNLVNLRGEKKEIIPKNHQTFSENNLILVSSYLPKFFFYSIHNECF